MAVVVSRILGLEPSCHRSKVSDKRGGIIRGGKSGCFVDDGRFLVRPEVVHANKRGHAHHCRRRHGEVPDLA